MLRITQKLGFKAPVIGIRTLATHSTEQPLPKTPSKVQLDSRKLSNPKKLYELIQSSIAKGEPHFKIGGKQLYFPTARVVLLRPNAKHTPYQAKFIVPKSFNRMDLRDYLYNLYGLRVFKITTQIIPGKFVREGVVARYRTGSIKKMTVDLLEPFVWPEEPKDKDEEYNVGFMNELDKYVENTRRLGSDKLKAGTAFGGALGPYPKKPEPFVPKFLKKKLLNEKNETKSINDKKENEKLISKYLNL
ncbi:54S ribosomal protein L41, mitochondrial [Wickerhamomyces ciferrii]|uniref:Large ribosomal subunit protein uL23m n=1 Tax=Wickerhamomyces ciferrii (strain ATCC 14091 / BCRC 22168 / CBS 111 / JCM 3599 / NBRC 0793 / NRRL Y-1031 F-60-10) TaxID=1206466 RepID=K0KL27_WICCF|nr:54S ribosomal protein L41, mitochondrial [Wickerhamomyces ciferrii]CCH43701.1 54S ribosomal protein L41, mitochondrial [Wickerhamomyces ciferrii]